MTARPLDVVFLEPWFGGSHRTFAESWTRRSRQQIDVVSLTPRHWKWRQEAAAWELARRVADRTPPDVIACSDYVDLPRLVGFLPPAWRALPTLAYFHESQLTYPGMAGGRDLTHAFCNVLSAIRADALVFNSAFHLEDFRAAADVFLSRLPKPSPRAELAAALERALVVPPLPELAAVPLGPGGAGALRVAFPHRLEHDKDPITFVRAVRAAHERGAALEIVLFGSHPETVDDEVRAALDEVAPLVASVGFVESREDYLASLGACDVVASTAPHEFFGVAFAEAMAAGCAPLALDQVNYPALVERYSGVAPGAGLATDRDDLVDRLIRLAAETVTLRSEHARSAARDAVLHLDAGAAAAALDDVVERVHAAG